MPTYIELFTSNELSRRERLLYRVPTVIAIGTLMVGGTYAGIQNMQHFIDAHQPQPAITTTQPPK